MTLSARLQSSSSCRPVTDAEINPPKLPKSGILEEVVVSREVVMANKQNFKPDEWTKIFRKHDVGRYGRFCRRTQRPVGCAQKRHSPVVRALATAKSNPGSSELQGGRRGFRDQGGKIRRSGSVAPTPRWRR